MNISSGGKFTRANNVLDALLKEKKKAGKEPVVQHKLGINSDDMDKLSAYFKNVEGDCHPVRLSQYVWFSLSLHFALRVGGVQTSLKKSDLALSRRRGEGVCNSAQLS